MSLLAEALELYQAGYTPVRATTDGAKRPVGGWKHYQTQRPTEDEVIDWFGGGQHGIGIITGSVSGNTEMLEFEGRAVDEGILIQWADIMDGSGLSELRERLRGWVEQSPSGGYHIHYRVDGTVPGNTKLARRPATDDELAENPDEKIKVLVETRGEGGFVITAPSNGTTHPSGKPWVRISGGPLTAPILTVDEHQALHDICRILDQMPEPTAVRPPRAPAGPQPDARPGDDYNDRATWADILDGWTLVYTDASGTSYWRRPGKSRGVSATTGRNDGDNLYVFSSSTEFDIEKAYSKFAAYTLLQHNGDYAAAAKQLRADGYGSDQPASSPTVLNDKGERVIPGALTETFWSARSALDHIRQAAWSRGRSAEAVLGAVLARIAADTHYVIKLPPTVGSRCGLSLIVALSGPPGSGKSSSKGIAHELVPARLIDPLCDDVPPGSGEGIIELLFDMVNEVDPNTNKQIRVKRQTRNNVFVYVDEGELLATQARRTTTNTILPTLRSVFTDGTLGQANASEERKRVVPGGHYVYGIVVGIQPEKAGALFDDAGGGTPQRFLWSATSTSVPPPGERPEWPGPLPRPKTPPLVVGPGGWRNLTLPDVVVAEIQANDHQKQQHGCSPLDEHADLVRLKVAGIVAILDGRDVVDLEDWELAGQIREASNATRSGALAVLERQTQDKEQAYRDKRSREAVAVDAAVNKRRVITVALKVGRKVHAEPERWTFATLRRFLGRDSDVYAEAVDHAVDEGYIVEKTEPSHTGNDQRWLRPGKRQP